jgi:hypothetical protein
MAAGGAEGVHPGADRTAEAGFLNRKSFARQSGKESAPPLSGNYEIWTIFSQTEKSKILLPFIL